jgi:hypothetical protein
MGISVHRYNYIDLGQPDQTVSSKIQFYKLGFVTLGQK